jgi:oligosaccharide repeat unit polymerase
LFGLIIIIILLIMLFIGKKLSKFWASPAYILTLYWTFFISAGLITFNGYEWKYLGLLWIVLLCVMFGIGHFLGTSFVNKKTLNVQHFNTIEVKTLPKVSWIFVLICILLGILRTFLEVKVNGFSLGMFFDLDSLVTMNTNMAHERYFGNGVESSVYMQILLVFIYAGPLCGGYAFEYSLRKIERILSIATFIPTILSLLLTNGKAGIIASILLWLSGYFVGYFKRHKKSPRVRYEQLFKVCSVGGILVGLLYFSMLLRIGDFSSATRTVVNNKFFTYAFGSIPAFDNFFMNISFDSNYGLGSQSLMGLSNTLGIKLREQGLYTDLVEFSNGTYTNVFTAFRALIIDFGIMGSLIFFALLGMITGLLFQNLVKGNESVFTRVLLASIYFYIMYSLLTSAWTYFSYLLAFIIFTFYLALVDKKISFKPISRKYSEKIKIINLKSEYLE